ncbi:MAG TPA: hypothetical protein VNQ90_15890 [Chthoniobacteraceae bacterium]|nr:hypothetical protein [Chthoniobacteraceae bacterium]
MTRTHLIVALGLGLGFLAGSARAATLLPVGPIDFDANSVYDESFRTNGLTGIKRSEIGGVNFGLRAAQDTGAAVFDQSSTGGTGGKGGTAGGQANNDLSNFTISGDLRFTSRTPANVGGFFLRLDDNDGNGYLATVELSSTKATFRLYEGVGVTAMPDAGQQIFSQEASFTSATTGWYRFSVTLEGDTFSFDLGDGTLTASYTDLTPTRSTGQVGVYLAGGSGSGSSTNLNHFHIAPIPEPSALALVAIPAAAFWLRGRKGRRR